MFNKLALSLYFIQPFKQFPTFFSECQQDFSLMLTLYGINVCYYFYILWSHFSKVILTTEEMIKTSYQVISATTQFITSDHSNFEHRRLNVYRGCETSYRGRRSVLNWASRRGDVWVQNSSGERNVCGVKCLGAQNGCGV